MSERDAHWMQQAIDVSRRGEGAVEPNPMVGCVLVADGEQIGIGWHRQFGGPHAEINAIQSVSSSHQHRLVGATAYVTLEPCSHQGKTGPCSQALLDAGIGRVVVAVVDPNPLVDGGGLTQLRNAGVAVETGVLKEVAADVLAPYLKRMTLRMPWVIGKWAMTLDGRIATAAGDSKWISGESSRRLVHDLRRRVDAVVVGIGTALADDPMLNARPSGDRTATRVIVDAQARLPLTSKLVTTANEFPTLIAVASDADQEQTRQLQDRGCQVFRADTDYGSRDFRSRLLAGLLAHLAAEGTTNVLVEGGGQLLGEFRDQQLIDEIHLFIGGKLVGGSAARSPVLGSGVTLIKDADRYRLMELLNSDGDVYAVYRRQQ